MQIKVMQVGQLGTNCYLLEDEGDPYRRRGGSRWGGARILAQLKADRMELKLILLTHAHFDHTGGVAELCAALPRVPVHLHPADAALVGGDVFPPSARETTPYQDGDVVKLGKMDIEVLHTPATPPAGDAEGGGRAPHRRHPVPGLHGPHRLRGRLLREIMASLGRLGRLSGDYHVLPGHMGAPSTLEQGARPITCGGRPWRIRRKAAAPRRKDTAHEAVFTRTRLQICRRADAAGSPTGAVPAGGPRLDFCIAGRSESRPAPRHSARERQQHGEGGGHEAVLTRTRLQICRRADVTDAVPRPAAGLSSRAPGARGGRAGALLAPGTVWATATAALSYGGRDTGPPAGAGRRS